MDTRKTLNDYNKLVKGEEAKIELYEKLIDKCLSDLRSMRKDSDIHVRQKALSKACHGLIEYGKGINTCLKVIAETKPLIESLEKHELLLLERDHDLMEIEDYVEIINKDGVIRLSL